jgi:uncharacterized protein YrrD
MEDLGEPSSYLTLKPGAAVYSSDGERLGAVEHVLAEPELDVFDGIVLDTSVLPGGHRFADAPHVQEVFDRGVVLKLTAAEAEDLPEPTANPGALEADADDAPPSGLSSKLQRAWDLISGNY